MFPRLLRYFTDRAGVQNLFSPSDYVVVRLLYVDKSFRNTILLTADRQQPRALILNIPVEAPKAPLFSANGKVMPDAYCMAFIRPSLTFICAVIFVNYVCLSLPFAVLVSPPTPPRSLGLHNSYGKHTFPRLNKQPSRSKPDGMFLLPKWLRAPP